ncbi:Hypothetical predicted protein [Podarcis lilfordi]|uniref:Uncharacterized protein n=1 Tax=Podarcis lilfordi TaxID=74358 RepID=A0AA35NZE6_9SAUR|nr:Hypothetical predicted protein [Podarcis lilfordi]
MLRGAGGSPSSKGIKIPVEICKREVPYCWCHSFFKVVIQLWKLLSRMICTFSACDHNAVRACEYWKSKPEYYYFDHSSIDSSKQKCTKYTKNNLCVETGLCA